jgi:pyruvate dehydrogenase E1 component beta subunit
MAQAITAAMRDAMLDDPSVILIGEDVADAGGVFKTSVGLVEEFGPARVRDTPISEMGFLGAGVGAAMAGLRPIVEIMFMDFLGVALDQLVTGAAKMRFLSCGQYSVPLVVRGSAGAGLGFASQHSQSIENWVTGVAGLKVLVPSDAASAYGLLRAAIRDDDPVVVIEPRALYGVRGDLVPSDGHFQIGRARTLTQGDEITVVALGSTVLRTLNAASQLNNSVEVIDLQSLIPWDRTHVLESVERTGRLAIVEESPYTGGWGSLISAEIAAAAFGQLKAPVLRITAPDAPIPYAESLEKAVVPSEDYISEQLTYLLRNDALPQPWWTRDAS